MYVGIYIYICIYTHICIVAGRAVAYHDAPHADVVTCSTETSQTIPIWLGFLKLSQSNNPGEDVRCPGRSQILPDTPCERL